MRGDVGHDLLDIEGGAMRLLPRMDAPRRGTALPARQVSGVVLQHSSLTSLHRLPGPAFGPISA